MGCTCSVPSVVAFDKRVIRGSRNLRKSKHRDATSSRSMFRRRAISKERPQEEESGMEIKELVELCTRTVNRHFQGSVDPFMVAAIALMESSAVSRLCKRREDFQENAYGIGQMLFSTAQFLLGAEYTYYRPECPEDLYTPTTALYFVSAYIDYLSKQKMTGCCEEYMVKGYHSGSHRVDDTPDEIWDVYLKARSQLLRLKNAMSASDPEKVIHVVQNGETIESIGRVCGVSVQDIMQVNTDIEETDSVQTGDCIEIPVSKILPRLYAVRSGDTVASIARKHDVSSIRLLNANADIKNPSLLKPGWVLSIPGLKGGSVEGRKRNDLIHAGVDDGPFFLNNRWSPRTEEMMTKGLDQDQKRRGPYSRSSMRRLLNSNKKNEAK